MKVIAINGSPNKNGNTSQALQIMSEELKNSDIEVEIIHLEKENIHGCIGCGYCFTNKQCVYKEDLVNETVKKLKEADGIILASPTYYAGISGTMKCFLDRVFFSSSPYFKYKVAACVSVVRRAGGVDVIHQLNNYFNLAQMIIAPSQYWTIAYGMNKGEILKDDEGIQTIKKTARDMAWLLKTVELGREKLPLPNDEEHIMTNFIRN